MEYAHRLIYAHFHGPIPTWMQIDHINGNRLDNRVENLRLVTSSGNHENLREAKSHSKSGLLGAFWIEAKKKFSSRIVVNGVSHGLGYFSSADAAHDAYVLAKRELHKHCQI